MRVQIEERGVGFEVFLHLRMVLVLPRALYQHDTSVSGGTRIKWAYCVKWILLAVHREVTHAHGVSGGINNNATVNRRHDFPSLWIGFCVSPLTCKVGK